MAMMIRSVPAWLTTDGKLFEKEDDAKAYEFEQALRAWVAEQRQGNVTAVDWSEEHLATIVQERAKLLTIFKLLNGGPAVTAGSIHGLEPLDAPRRAA